ncbi:hypothetical protein LTR04_003026 [Oleoguttula sp. CCFEE 6159]|nr:hypothetical protein LTR04_003026 [Oleoguttula sp. CCFEE 6159]
MAHSLAGVQYQDGDIVPFHINPGIVVASYFVSLAGTITTVEQLHRRVTGKKWLKWMQLIACAVSMGLIGIWCMHFIGNRAIVLANGEYQLQLFYSPGFTTISVFLPIVCLFFAFAVAELRLKSTFKERCCFLFAGIVAGLSIVGMHYIGNLGIVNYRLEYLPGYIAGACVVAVVDCVGTLVLFFYWKELWINRLWRRLLCAASLALAVSAMHWVASVGCEYRFKGIENRPSGSTRNTTLIIAVALCTLACAVCAVIVWSSHVRRKHDAAKAAQIVLACATFDSEGRLMVTQDGLLPCQKITNQYNQRTFDDEFNISHPAFQWIFRVTHNWTGVTDLIPSMRTHLRALSNWKDDTRPSSSSNSSFMEDENNIDYSVIFRESFCVAASDLANALSEPLKDIGVLYDAIMNTGSLDRPKTHVPFWRPNNKSTVDLESGVVSPPLFGKGQLLFVVRQANHTERARLESRGYRFASIDHVGSILARNMQVPAADLLMHVDRLRNYRRVVYIPERNGTFLACFAIRAKPSHQGFDVLVQRKHRDRLPSVRLSPEQLGPWHTHFLSQLEGMSVAACLQWLGAALSNPEVSTPRELNFIQLLHTRIEDLVAKVNEPWFGHQAIFTSHGVVAHYTSPTDTVDCRSTIFAFCAMAEVHHTSAKLSNELVYTSFSFFKSRQRTYKHSPDHALLVREIHQEFSPFLARKELRSASAMRRGSVAPQGSQKSRRSLWPFKTASHPRWSVSTRNDSSSERDTADSPSRLNSSAGHSSGQPWGGILTTSETVVDTTNKTNSYVEMHNMGISADVTAMDKEEITFVDELFAVTRARFQHHQS